MFFLIGWAQGDLQPVQLNALFSQWFANSMSNFTFLAIPFFVFMGAIFEKSGLAERLLTTIGMILGPGLGGWLGGGALILNSEGGPPNSRGSCPPGR